MGNKPNLKDYSTPQKNDKESSQMALTDIAPLHAA
jgi:hypothetical protein